MTQQQRSVVDGPDEAREECRHDLESRSHAVPRQWVPRSLHETFEFFERPQNLARITPPWLGFRILTPEPIRMGPGSRSTTRCGCSGCERTGARSSASTTPRTFRDVQVIGPYRMWDHRHRFWREDGGTAHRGLRGVRAAARPPGPPAGPRIVRRQLEAIFDYRQAQIEALLPDRRGVPGVTIACCRRSDAGRAAAGAAEAASAAVGGRVGGAAARGAGRVVARAHAPGRRGGRPRRRSRGRPPAGPRASCGAARSSPRSTRSGGWRAPAPRPCRRARSAARACSGTSARPGTSSTGSPTASSASSRRRNSLLFLAVPQIAAALARPATAWCGSRRRLAPPWPPRVASLSAGPGCRRERSCRSSTATPRRRATWWSPEWTSSTSPAGARPGSTSIACRPRGGGPRCWSCRAATSPWSSTTRTRDLAARGLVWAQARQRRAQLRLRPARPRDAGHRAGAPRGLARCAGRARGEPTEPSPEAEDAAPARARRGRRGRRRPARPRRALAGTPRRRRPGHARGGRGDPGPRPRGGDGGRRHGQAVRVGQRGRSPPLRVDLDVRRPRARAISPAGSTSGRCGSTTSSIRPPIPRSRWPAAAGVASAPAAASPA